MIQSEKLKEHARVSSAALQHCNCMAYILHHAQEEKPTYPELVLGLCTEFSDQREARLCRDALLCNVCPENIILTNTTTIFMRAIHRRASNEVVS